MIKRVCIFCGAKTGNSERITTEVKKLCSALANEGYDLVYGGGNSGLMGIVADTFLKAEREVIGVRPQKLIIDEDAHNDLNNLIVVEDMFERKRKMIEISDVFISLPGGVGTLDEAFEVYVQNKIGFIDKKCALFNIDGFYDNLIKFLNDMVSCGFLKEADKDKLIIENDYQELIKLI